MKYLIFILIAAFTFAGCASEKIWYSADKTIEQTKLDYKQCESYMLEQDYTRTRFGPPPRQYLDSCMTFKGYNLTDVESLEAQGIKYYKGP